MVEKLSNEAMSYASEFKQYVNSEWFNDLPFILGEALYWRGYVEHPQNEYVLYERSDKEVEQMRLPEPIAKELMSYAKKRAENGVHTI